MSLHDYTWWCTMISHSIASEGLWCRICRSPGSWEVFHVDAMTWLYTMSQYKYYLYNYTLHHFGDRDCRMFIQIDDRSASDISWQPRQELHVLGDGNCQFRALADQLAPYYSQECHENVRAAVVQQLRCVPDRYRPFVTEDYDEWVDRMAADKEWGNEITLRAAADAFGVEIHVFADNLGEGQLYSSYEPMKKKMDKLIRLVFRSVRGDSGHYNSVESYKKGFPLKWRQSTSIPWQAWCDWCLLVWYFLLIRPGNPGTCYGYSISSNLHPWRDCK